MGLFKAHTKTQTPPPGCTAADIVTQSSICTGETVIGFRQKGTDALALAELVRGREDIRAYYRSFGFAAPK